MLLSENMQNLDHSSTLLITFKDPRVMWVRKRMSSNSQNHPKKITKEFCEATSLHGFNFLYNADTIFVRLIWIFAIIAMMGLGTFFLVKITITYSKSRISTNFESSLANLDVSTIYSNDKTLSPILFR